MQISQQLVDLLYFLVERPGSSEYDVAVRFFNGRVLGARHSLSYLLWSGAIFGNRYGGYRLTPMAMSLYLDMSRSVPQKIMSRK